MSSVDLIDIGANLTHESFGHDLPEVIRQAAEMGVSQLMVTGASLEGSEAALALAAQYQGTLFPTAGIHPHHAEEADEAGMARLVALLDSGKVKAVGETGLDYFRDFSPRDQQAAAFARHIELAIDYQLPMFLHERDAYPDFHDQLAPYRKQLPDAVVHCFTGEREALEAYLDLDCYIGITGWICDERRGYHLHELIKLIPLNRLMIETDSPYLMPRNLKPKPKTRRNEPQYLAHINAYIAGLLDMTPGELATQTSDNARRFFRL